MNILKILYLPYKIIKKSKILKKKKLTERFEQIYKENFWDNAESVSGPGSSFKNSTRIR